MFDSRGEKPDISAESPFQQLFHGRNNAFELFLLWILNATEQQYQSTMRVIEAGINQSEALNEEVSVKAFIGILFEIAAKLRAGITARDLMFFQQ